jgi:hypothetical protein
LSSVVVKPSASTQTIHFPDILPPVAKFGVT